MRGEFQMRDLVQVLRLSWLQPGVQSKMNRRRKGHLCSERDSRPVHLWVLVKSCCMMQQPGYLGLMLAKRFWYKMLITYLQLTSDGASAVFSDRFSVAQVRDMY